MLFSCYVSFSALAQFPYFNYFQDSIKPGYRISGTLDSADVVLSRYQSSLPTPWRPALDLFSPQRFYNMDYQREKLRFSAISHVGLTYSVGSNNTQRGGISWTQALDSNLFIQFDYERISTAGYLRNNGMNSNRVDMDLLYRKNRVASQLSLYFLGSDRAVNGGLLGDSINPGFALIYSDVEHPDASTKKRNFQVDWMNYFSFTGDSSLRTGVYLGPNLRIETRNFAEQGLMDSLYGVVNYDTLITNDNWQKSEIGATAGYFFETDRIAIKGSVKYNYWMYDNEIRHQDTAEATVLGELKLKFSRNLVLSGNTRFTFLGAIGESALNGSLKWSDGNLSASVDAGVTNAYPMLYQRYFYGNTLNYSWTNKTLSTVTNAAFNLAYKNRIAPVSVRVGYGNYNKMPFFVGNTWRQDTLTNISALYASARADFRLKKLFAQPAFTYQQVNIGYAPQLQAWFRFGFDGYLFKGRKLHNITGFEAGYTSSFQLLDFSPRMDTYVFPSAVAVYQAMPRIHFFTQFDLGFLRWFIRVENIEQAFLTYKNQEALGYPVAPLQFRLGVGWDLFN